MQPVMANTFDNWKLKAGRTVQKIVQESHFDARLTSFAQKLTTTAQHRRRWVPPVGDLENPANQQSRQEVVRYLHTHNYLGQWEGQPDPSRLSSALANLQQEAGIATTGVYDYDTARMMERPHCPGPPPSPSDANSTGGFNFTTGINGKKKWDKTHLTYRFTNTSMRIGANDCFEAVRKAYQQWMHVTPLKFTEIPMNDARPVDMVISYGKGDHGCGTPFDDRGGVLAHAIYPYSTQTVNDAPTWLHFDDAEDWTLAMMLAVSLHEIGHMLGMHHSLETSAVMYAYYDAAKMELRTDDIMGVQSLYGSRTNAWEQVQLPTQIAENSRIAVVSHNKNDLDVFFTDPNGAVMCMGWEPVGKWDTQQISAPGTTTGKAIAAVSRLADHIEVFWTATNGSVMGMHWTAREGHSVYVVAAPGSADVDSEIVAISRIWSTMDVFWISPSGAVVNAHWETDNPSGYAINNITPPTWAYPGVITALSRNFNVLEIYFLGPDGDVKEFSWSTSRPTWSYFQVAPAGTARIGGASSITSVAPTPDRVEVFWFNAQKGGVDNAYWQSDRGWNRWHAPVDWDQGAFVSLTSFTRRTNHMEIWWGQANASVVGYVWLDADPNAPPPGAWRKWSLMGEWQEGSIAVTSRLGSCVRNENTADVFARGPSGNLINFALRLL